MENKKLVLSLIKDNLIHTRLLMGLEALGFCTLHYVTNLEQTILELMDVHINDEQYESYVSLFSKVSDIDIAERSGELDEMANQIYEAIAENKFKTSG